MPLIHCNFIKDVFNEEEKKQVITNITDAIADVKGEGIRDLVMVMIHEVDSGDVGKAGNQVTTKKVQDMVAAG